MNFFRSPFGRLCLFTFLCSATIAAPVSELNNEIDASFNKTDFEKRDPGDSKDEAISVTFKIAGWPNIAEENCYAMLCLLNGRRDFQRTLGEGERTTNYRTSGGELRPFQAQNLQQRHTAQINPDTTSGEEFPWRSIHWNQPSYLFPATLAEQRSQGGVIGRALVAAQVGFGKWFHISFTGAPFGTYCTALFQTPPDTSVCGKQPKEELFSSEGVNIADYAYQLTKDVRPYQFMHIAGSNKGQKRSESLESSATDADDVTTDS